MSILIKNVHIAGEAKNVRCDICIEGNRIKAIGRAPEGAKFDEVIDGSRKSVLPGFVNCHTHSYMSLFRNFADDLPFEEWLFERITPREEALSFEDAYWGNILSFAEMIRTGTTSYVDMHMFKNMSAKAAFDTGMRAVLTRGLVGTDRNDEGGQRRIQEVLDEMEYVKEIGSNATFMLAPHAIYTCGEDYLRYVNELASEYGLPVHIHMAETRAEYENCVKEHGQSPIKYLKSTGLLERKALLAHCVRLDDDDLDILSADNISVVTNPASNMKLANGFAPVPEMLEHGINVCLGTDSAASNNSLNMITEMHLLSLVHKGVKEDALTLTAKETLKLATVNGYKAIGLEGEGGQIKEGMLADIILIDEDSPSIMPNFDIVSALVYSANGSEVADVIIDGKIVMRNKELLTIDEEQLIYNIDRITAEYK